MNTLPPIGSLEDENMPGRFKALLLARFERHLGELTPKEREIFERERQKHIDGIRNEQRKLIDLYLSA